VNDSASVGAFRCVKVGCLASEILKSQKGLKHPKETKIENIVEDLKALQKKKLVRSPKTNGHESTNKINSPIPAQGTTGHMTT
jgi:hypothetical protein